MKNHFNKALAVCAVIFFLARLVFLGIVGQSHPDGLKTLYWDVDAQRHYAVASESPRERAESLLWDAPLFGGLVSAMFGIFGHQAAVPVLFNVCVFLLSAVMLFLIADYLFGRRRAWWAVVLYLAYPSFFVYSFLPFPDPLFVFFFLAAFYFFVRLRGDRRYVFAVGLGVSAGFCVITKESALFLPLLFFLLLLFDFRRGWRHGLCAGVLVIASCASIVLPQMAYNKSHFGEWTVSGKMSVYMRFLGKVQRKTVPLSVVKGEDSRSAGIIAVPPAKHAFSWLVDYVSARRQFFFGTGTISLMRASGIETSSLAVIPFRIPEYIRLVQEKGNQWVLFQILSWIFIALAYCCACIGFIKLIVRKHVACAALFFCCIVYFLGAYYWNFNARHFTVLVPLLALLAASVLTGVPDEKAL